MQEARQRRKVNLLMDHAGDPRNAHETVFHFDLDSVAVGKLVEIDPVDRNPFKLAALAPRAHNQPPIRHRSGHGEFPDDMRFDFSKRSPIKRAVEKQQAREQPWDGDQSVIDAFQRLQLRMLQRLALEPNGNAQRQKKQHPDKDKNAVDFQRRVLVAEGDERDSAEQEQSRAI